MKKTNFRNWKIGLALILGAIGSQLGIAASHANLNYTSFRQWCEAKESLPEETRYTVEVLLKSIRTEDCYDANIKLSILNNLLGLSLLDNQVSDLTPLASLIQLDSLDLSNNQIEDVSLLANMSRLQFLELQDNRIQDVSPLAQLVDIRIINLDDNQIQDATSLGVFQNRESVCLRGNPLTPTSASLQFSCGELYEH
ncbi:MULTISPECIES: leucine-rich repeat domain-containing protein [Spirulina sp. CCY15215]|uniref:leucine-rich repeat domain-containing protein n=1 Tax=Spirulina sp. CCY15215 TaxID=2767591 RepID=UPI001951D8DC|nr:leucine-rich repeat domain-containing protein [Spirulina major]